MAVRISEGDLYIPSASHVRRLRLGQGDAACLEDQHQRNNEARMTNDERSTILRHLIIRNSFELRHSDFVILRWLRPNVARPLGKMKTFFRPLRSLLGFYLLVVGFE
jgi:hypothetical protein